MSQYEALLDAAKSKLRSKDKLLFPTFDELKRQYDRIKSGEIEPEQGNTTNVYTFENNDTDGARNAKIILDAQSKDLAALSGKSIVLKDINLIGADEKNPLEIVEVDDFDRNESFNEVAIGTRLNFLRDAGISSAFSLTYDWFFYGNKYDINLLLALETQYPDGFLQKQMTGILEGISQDTYVTKSLLLQLVAGLAAAQRAFGFVHYDLHSKNYMFQKVDTEKKYWRINLGQNLEYFIDTEKAGKLQGRIIDFGRCRLDASWKLKGGADLVYIDGDKDTETELFLTKRNHPFWDLRRFSMELVEQLIELIRILDDMAGFQYIPLPNENDEEVSAHYKKLLEDPKLLNVYLEDVTNYKNVIGILKTAKLDQKKNAISDRIEEMRSGGIEFLIKQITAEVNGGWLDDGKASHWGYFAALVWGWTPFYFPGRPPEHLLIDEFFNEFRIVEEPDDVETIAEYKTVLQLRLAKASTSTDCQLCGAEALLMCPNCERPYCSTACGARDFYELEHGSFCRMIYL
jgi:hypothetical protein